MLALLIFVAALAIAGCGDDADDPPLRVSAAASLQTAFSAYADSAFPGERIDQSFGGSDDLAAQIQQGARPDVFASANTEYPAKLYDEGLVERPLMFARNRLVLAVPAGSAIRSLAMVAAPGVSVVIGDPGVPVGAYTREVLDGLPAGERRAILANVRSQEPDVGSIVGKLTQGAADAGFVYLTDVRAAGASLRAITLPAELRPDVEYAVAVVRDAPSPDLAERFVDGLEPGGAGARFLAEAGFLPPRD